MSDFGFRMYFGGRPATAEELERVEEIVVEQEMDMAWEARIRLYLCLDENGTWRSSPQEFAQPFSRVRVEIGSGSSFTPLIDGPVASYDTALDSQPGRSSVTLVVRDDSVLLNREEKSAVFENRPDELIALTVFGEFPDVIRSTRVQPPGGARTSVSRRGTAIQFLRELARAHEYHAYVLPGALPGQGVGCFLPDPLTPGRLPPLVLMGDDRSLTDVEITEASDRPERTSARTLRIADQRVVSAQRTVQDLVLMRPLPPLRGTPAAQRQVPPGENDREDADARALGQQRRASYAYRIRGKVVPGCYAGILAPYQRVSVRVGTLPLSGEWLLTKVTHSISPNLYTQEFEAKADSVEAPAAAGAGGGVGGAGLSVSFSASLSIF
jgi:hypothetical protein